MSAAKAPAILLVVVCIFPYLWFLASSFKTRRQAQHTPPLWMFDPSLENYSGAFVHGPFLRHILNSTLVAVLSTTLAISLALPAAYALSQMRRSRSKRYEFLILTTRMAPPISLALPLYGIFARLGLLDTLFALSLAHAAFNVSFAILIMKGFYDAVPTEVLEAARLDGIGWLAVLSKITLPFVRPGVIVATVFSLIFSWNDFFLAKILVDRNGTLPVALLGLDTIHGTEWGQLSAVCTVITVPIVAFAWLVQKYIVRGLTYGVLK